VGIRLGANICEPHECLCGAMVDAKGLHGLSCKGGSGRSARHHSFNDLVWCALSKADIPTVEEPSGLLRIDGKRPDCITLIPWKDGRCVTWYVTVTDSIGYNGTVLPSSDISHVGCSSRSGGRQEDSQVCPTDTGIFVIPIAAETMGAVNSDGIEFLDDLGRCFTQVTNDNGEKAFLYQQLSVLIQRYNLVVILAHMTPEDEI